MMRVSVTFKAPQILPREAANRYRYGAREFRKVDKETSRSTYERVCHINDDDEHLVNRTMAAVHEVFDIARAFGLEGFKIVDFGGKILDG